LLEVDLVVQEQTFLLVTLLQAQAVVLAELFIIQVYLFHHHQLIQSLLVLEELAPNLGQLLLQ
jgi:hypothetical protein